MKSDEKAKESPARRAKRARRPKPGSIGRTSLSHTPSPNIQPEEVSLTWMLETLQPHDHLCLIYESQEEWRAAAVPFISIGLKRGEKCIYIVDTSTAAEIRTYLGEEGVDVASAEKSGQLSILHESEAYTREGSFDPDRMIALLISEAEKAVAEGYPAIRATGEMTWVLRGHPGSEKLLEYEAKLNRDFFPKYPCLAICQYDRWKFDPEIIKGIVMTHPLLIKGNRVYRNFYYIPPEEFLNEKRAEIEAQHWLNNLEREQRAWEALRESEERYRRITQAVTDYIYRVRVKEGNVTETTHGPGCVAVTGYSEQEFAADPYLWHRMVLPEDRPRVEEQVRQLLAGKDPLPLEHRIFRKDGALRWVSNTPVLHRDEHGRLLSYDGLIQDITERKWAEEELIAAKKVSEDIIENANALVMGGNAKGELTIFNNKFGDGSQIG